MGTTRSSFRPHGDVEAAVGGSAAAFVEGTIRSLSFRRVDTCSRRTHTDFNRWSDWPTLVRVQYLLSVPNVVVFCRYLRSHPFYIPIQRNDQSQSSGLTKKAKDSLHYSPSYLRSLRLRMILAGTFSLQDKRTNKTLENFICTYCYKCSTNAACPARS